MSPKQPLPPLGELFPLSVRDFCSTALWLTGATLFSLAFNRAFIEPYNAALVYMLTVVIIASRTSGYLYGLLAAVVGVIGVNFFFTDPFFSLNFTISGYPFTFAVMFIASLVTGALTSRMQEAARQAKRREERTEILYEVATHLSRAESLSEMVEVTLETLTTLFGCSTVLYLGHPGDTPPHLRLMGEPGKDFESASALLQAQKVYEEGRELHFRTDDGSLIYHLPLHIRQGSIGVVGFYIKNPQIVSDEEQALLHLVITQSTLAIARQQSLERQIESAIEIQREKLRGNLLRSISHDLRTPLTGILGASEAIQQQHLDPTAITQMACGIQENVQWLIRMVENLLSITRLKGTDAVQRTPELVEEVVGEVVGRIRRQFPDEAITVHVPNEVLFVPMDGTLIEQVLANLIHNAIHHSGSREPIAVQVQLVDGEAVFSVADHGRGIPPQALPHIFEGESRWQGELSSDSTRGMGIGLSLCRAIILAHGGRIWAQNNPTGGATFAFALTCQEEATV